MLIFQWKEYGANNENDGGANIPLSLKVRKGVLQLGYQAKLGDHRSPVWTKEISTNTVYKVGLEILAKKGDGHVRLWWNGKPATFTETHEQVLTGNLWGKQTDPKVGIYGGEEVETDSWVYQVQVGTKKGDVDGKFFGEA